MASRGKGRRWVPEWKTFQVFTVDVPEFDALPDRSSI